MANKTLIRKFLREFKKRPIVKYVAPIVINEPRIELSPGVTLRPVILKHDFILRPWDMEKDPMHERRIIGNMLVDFQRHLQPAHIVTETEIDSRGNKTIRGTFVFMAPPEDDALTHAKITPRGGIDFGLIPKIPPYESLRNPTR